MTARAKKVLAVLAAANGCWVDSQTIGDRVGIGRRHVAAGIREARDFLGAEIETHEVRGGGWRLVGPSPEAVAPPTQGDGKPLSIRARAMINRLEEAGGNYVDGHTLAAAIGAGIEQLPTYAGEIRRKMPDLRLQGQRGSGYRLGALAEIAGLPPAPRQVTRETAHRTTLDLLATLRPATAEKLRSVALEANETVDQALYRLLEYGIEVHHDLIVHGHHPLQLRRAA